MELSILLLKDNQNGSSKILHTQESSLVDMTGGMQTVVQQTPASAQVPAVVAAIGGWRKSGLGGGSSLSTGAWPHRAQSSVSVRTGQGGDTECGGSTIILGPCAH